MSPAELIHRPGAAIRSVGVCRVRSDGLSVGPDDLAVEEPLEVRLGCGRPVAVTMRTPGHDGELAVGYLFTEGIIRRREDVVAVRTCSRDAVRVELAAGVASGAKRLERRGHVTSACGVCGKAALESIRVEVGERPADGWPVVDAAVIQALPAALRRAQAVFDRTGGLHASALFDVEGRLLSLREDVGRHNALDKLIGAEVLAGRTPLADRLLLVSGRASFELVQKAAVAGLPLLAAVGAPSSLAVELAAERGLTVIGFVRDDRFNVYTGAGRVQQTAHQEASERCDTL